MSDAFIAAFDSKDASALRALIVDHRTAQRFITLYQPESLYASLLPHAVALLQKPAELLFETYPEVVEAILRGGKQIHYGRYPFPWTREIIAAHLRICPIPNVIHSFGLMAKRDPQLVEMLIAAEPQLLPHRESLAQYRYVPKAQAFAREAIKHQRDPLVKAVLKAAFAKVLAGTYDDLTLREAYLLHDLGLEGIRIITRPDNALECTPDVCESVLDSLRDVFRCTVDPRVERYYYQTC